MLELSIISTFKCGLAKPEGINLKPLRIKHWGDASRDKRQTKISPERSLLNTTKGWLSTSCCFFNTFFVSSLMYPENPEGVQVIVGSMNMGYISDTARNRTHNLFRPKREPIPLGHSDGRLLWNSRPKRDYNRWEGTSRWWRVELETRYISVFNYCIVHGML